MNKAIITAMIIFLSTSSFASDDKHKMSDEQKKEMLEMVKTQVMSNIDKRIGILQEAKSCTSSAQKREDMKACRKSTKSKMQAIKEDAKAARKEFKKNRKNK